MFQTMRMALVVALLWCFGTSSTAQQVGRLPRVSLGNGPVVVDTVEGKVPPTLENRANRTEHRRRRGPRLRNRFYATPRKPGYFGILAYFAYPFPRPKQRRIPRPRRSTEMVPSMPARKRWAC